MASPSPDPFSSTPSEAPSQPAPAPAKRSLFKNRKPKVVKTAEEEAAEALDFFSRSKQVFPEAIREQRERREREEQRKKEKEQERKRREEEDAARQLKEENRVQERLDAWRKDGSQDEFSTPGGETRRRSRSYSETKSTPSLRRSPSRDSPIHLDDGASPPHKRRSPRHQRTTRSQVEKPVILLSSDEDDDEDIKLAKQRSLASRDHDNGYDAFTSSPPRAAAQRKRSPSIEEVVQEDEMFPELVAAARAHAAAEQASKLTALQRQLGRTKSASSNGSGSPRDPGVDSPAPVTSSLLATMEVDRVKGDAVMSIYVDSRVKGLSKPIIVKRKLSQRFKDVRMAWCDRQLITSHGASHRSMTDIEKEQIFLSWRGRRVWDVTTAESLGIRVERGRVVDERGGMLGEGGNLHLEAWTGEAWEEWQRERKAEKNRLAAGTPYVQGQQVDLDDEEDEPAASDPAEPEPAPAPQQERIKIILKPRTGEPVKLIVKPTTLVETIVRGFIQQRAELCEGKQVELWFDGERLEMLSSVGDADVDDMSGVDVVLRDVEIDKEAAKPVEAEPRRDLKRRRSVDNDSEVAEEREAQRVRDSPHEEAVESWSEYDYGDPPVMTRLTLLHSNCAPVKLTFPEDAYLSDVVNMFRAKQKRLTRGKDTTEEIGDGWMLDVRAVALEGIA